MIVDDDFLQCVFIILWGIIIVIIEAKFDTKSIK